MGKTRKLVDVYCCADRYQTLYGLLSERAPHQNISHKQMPSWDDHVRFVDGRPYTVWYFILDKNETRVGSIYLTPMREVGIFLFPEHTARGHGSWALREIMERFPGRILANINPANDGSRKFFERHGFRTAQHTMVNG